MLKSLSAMEFKHVQLLLEHLYNEMLEEKLDTEKVVDWISMLLDSHHTHIMVSKDLKIICLIKQLVDSLVRMFGILIDIFKLINICVLYLT